MKPILLLSTLILFAQQVAMAQFDKGTTLINGSLRLQLNQTTPSTTASNNRSMTRDNSTYYQWNFSPEVGQMINKNMMVGCGLAVSGYKDDFKYTEKNNGVTDIFKNSRVGNSYGGYLFVRKYFKILEPLRCFTGVELGSFYGKNMNNGSINSALRFSDKTNFISTEFSITGGLELAVTKHWLLHVGLNNFFGASYNKYLKNQNYQYDAAGVITNYYTVTGGSNINLAAGLATSLFNFGVAYCLLPKVKSQPITPMAK